MTKHECYQLLAKMVFNCWRVCFGFWHGDFAAGDDSCRHLRSLENTELTVTTVSFTPYGHKENSHKSSQLCLNVAEI